MARKICVPVALLIAAASGLASQFPMGMEFSRQIAPGVTNAASTVAMTVDAAGAIYTVGFGDGTKLPATSVLGPTAYPAYFVMKTTPDASSIVYLTILGIQPHAIAVDPSGNVYLGAETQVAKLSADGTKMLYDLTVGSDLVVSAVAVDAAGHAFATGWTGTAPLATTPGAFQPSASSDSHAFAVRVNAAGSGFDYATYIAGSHVDNAYGIAVDGTGAALVRGTTQSPDFPVTPGAYRTSGASGLVASPFLVRVSPDGSSLIYSTLLGAPGESPQAVATDEAGDAVVAEQMPNGYLNLLRFNPQGALALRSRTLPSLTLTNSGEAMAMDAAGNAYLTGFATGANFPVKGSQTACGSMLLAVFDPSGNMLQSTYLGGAEGSASSLTGLGVAQDGSVYMAGAQSGATAAMTVVKLSARTPPQTVGLACVGNAASFDAGPVAPGEIVSLFGEGLGPATGTQPSVTLTSGFPMKLANVAVTFDGTPAPLIYVQDGQINTIVPWRMQAGQTTNLCVTYNGGVANCLQKTLAAVAPGVFTVDGVHAAALNQDGSVNTASHPAPPGSMVSIFATGLGPLSPMPADGSVVNLPLPRPVVTTQPAAFIGGIAFVELPITPQYSGPAPLEVAGVSQINFPVSPSTMLLQSGPDLGITGLVRSKSFSLYVASK
jgi:uncharacterized protein (TIGR03437 family)